MSNLKNKIPKRKKPRIRNTRDSKTEKKKDGYGRKMEMEGSCLVRSTAKPCIVNRTAMPEECRELALSGL